MKLLCYLITACSLAVAAHAAPPAAPGLLPLPVERGQLTTEYQALTRQLVAEWLQTGRLSTDSIQSYDLLVAMAARSGVRLERTPLRTKDERSLGPALAIATLERLRLSYDRIYDLHFQGH